MNVEELRKKLENCAPGAEVWMRVEASDPDSETLFCRVRAVQTANDSVPVIVEISN